MASQSVSTIVAALITVITDANLGFSLVARGPLHPDEMTSKMPACIVSPGRGRVAHHMGGSEFYEARIDVEMFSKTSAAAIETLDEAVCDAISSDPTLIISGSATCVGALIGDLEEPMDWPGDYYLRVRAVNVMYIRD